MGIKKIKIAIIGAGYMADEHLKVLTKLQNVELVGIFNRTKKNAMKLKKKYKIQYFFSKIDDMYKKTKADGVIVAISPNIIKKISKEIFLHPWKCLIEKPIGLNYEETKYIYKISKKLSSQVFIAFNRRYYSSTQNLIKQISKTNKKKRIVVVQDQQNIFKLKSRFKKIILDNFMYVNSIHLIDYFSFLCRGKIVKIESTNDWENNKKQILNCKIYYSSGDIGYYNALWNLTGPWSVTVYQDNNAYQLKPLEKFFVSKKNSLKFKEIKTFDDDDKKFKPGLKKLNQTFVECLLNKKTSLPSFNEALKTTKIINSIYKV